MTCDKCARLANCKHANEYVSSGIKVKETIHNCRDFKSADLVEVVRCKDCKYLELELPYAVCSKARLGMVSPDDFCSRGERKTE